MRKVMVSENKHRDGEWQMIERGEAMFHQFGVEYEEFESGPGNFSTAIIEWPDGTMGNVPVRHVRFIDVI